MEGRLFQSVLLHFMLQIFTLFLLMTWS